ncbi:MAG: hypothetical protein U1D55_03010 [Phycisphaerae bacterium]
MARWLAGLAAIMSLALVLPLSPAQNPQPNVVQPTPPPQRKPATQRPLTGKEKLQYIVSQVDLTAEQEKHVSGLFERYENDTKQEQERVQKRVEEIRALYAEIQAAEQAGDQKKKDALNEQLRLMAPGVQAEEDFLRDFATALTPPQKTQFDAVKARLVRAPDGGLRPADLLNIIQGFKLTDDQMTRVNTVKEGFRKSVNEMATLEDPQRAEVLQRFSNDLRGVLTTEQQAEYDKKVTRMRPPAAKITGTLPGGGTIEIQPVDAPPWMKNQPAQPGAQPAGQPTEKPTPTTMPK